MWYKAAVYVVLILTHIVFIVDAKLQCNCKKATCVKPKGCIAGTRRDICNCCEICAKVEGDVCSDSIHVGGGECGYGMKCKRRKTRYEMMPMRNDDENMIGRCEYEYCHKRICPFGQICMIIYGEPICQCPTCDGVPKNAVCGTKNNKQYKNECELRKEECITRKSIGVSYGSCRNQKYSKQNQITCGNNSVVIELSKTLIPKKFMKKLTLADSKCTLQQNETHLFRTIKFDECDTKVKHTLNSITYSNLIRSSSIHRRGPIIRRKGLQIPFDCEYILKNTLSNSNSHKVFSSGQFGEKAIANLRSNQLAIKIRRDSLEPYKTIPGEISVNINPNQRYIVQFSPRRLPKFNVKAYPTFCFATPVSKRQRWMRYTLIEDGCPIEESVLILKSHRRKVKILVPDIQFRGARYPGVIIRCKVKACYQNRYIKCNRPLCLNNLKKRKAK